MKAVLIVVCELSNEARIMKVEHLSSRPQVNILDFLLYYLFSTVHLLHFCEASASQK